MAPGNGGYRKDDARIAHFPGPIPGAVPRSLTSSNVVELDWPVGGFGALEYPIDIVGETAAPCKFRSPWAAAGVAACRMGRGTDCGSAPRCRRGAEQEGSGGTSEDRRGRWPIRSPGRASLWSLSTGRSSRTRSGPLLAEPDLAHRYQLILYHRRGYGGSSCAAGPIGIAQQAADCQALLRSLGVERAHVVGHSYGGNVALQLALDAPDVAHSLALLEPGFMVGRALKVTGRPRRGARSAIGTRARQ